MGSIAGNDKHHAVCIPYPAQGHINPLFKLAKLLHHQGFHITFVNTEFNHKRLLKSRGPAALDGLPDFRFETIPDGLPPSDDDATQDIPSLCESTTKTCLAPFCSLLTKLNNAAPEMPPVTCIVSDGAMSFTLKAAEQFGLPEVMFWTTSACGFLGYTQYANLIERGCTPLKGSIQTIPFSSLSQIKFLFGFCPPGHIRVGGTITSLGRWKQGWRVRFLELTLGAKMEGKPFG